jgi:hypothetical protein
MLYEFQATYRTKGEEGISPVQATKVLAKDEVRKHRIPRAFIMKRLFRNIGHREVAA